MAMSGGILTHSRAREATISAVITRADGRIEDIGVINYWHRNPLRRLAFWLKEKINGRTRSK